MVHIPRLHLPMLNPTDVIPHLGAEHHYREGRSACLIAETWFAAQREARGLPTMIQHVLDQNPRFVDAELVDAFLERWIELGDGLKPSQADVLAVLRVPDALAVMAVEGKVDETFGPRVLGWLGSSPSKNKTARFARLCATLGLNPAAADPLRYQLLHRTASAIYEAKRYHANTAVMMVHSFDPKDAGLSDFKAFASALGLPSADAARLVGPVLCDGIDLFLGWSADRASSEGFSIADGRKTDAGFHDDD
jgi:hypothetical protein